MARHATVDSARLVKTVRLVYKQFVAEDKAVDGVAAEVGARLGCGADYVEKRINALRSIARKENPTLDDEKILAVYPLIGGKRGASSDGVKVTSADFILGLLAEDETAE